jgi:uncharacterized protein (TIGR00730 family)
MADRGKSRSQPRTRKSATAAGRAPASAPSSVCVYCGSGLGSDPAYAEAARALGRHLAAQNIGLIYGGGGRGLMGELAQAAIDAGGRVVGIIPEFLIRAEHAMRSAHLIVTNDMHERKLQMYQRADAFVALPGGIGTLEEFVEQLTWNQIGQHNKPLVLVNVLGYWDPLVALFRHMERNRFIRPGLAIKYAVVGSVDEVVPAISRGLARAQTGPRAARIAPEKL